MPCMGTYHLVTWFMFITAYEHYCLVREHYCLVVWFMNIIVWFMNIIVWFMNNIVWFMVCSQAYLLLKGTGI